MSFTTDISSESCSKPKMFFQVSFQVQSSIRPIVTHFESGLIAPFDAFAFGYRLQGYTTVSSTHQQNSMTACHIRQVIEEPYDKTDASTLHAACTCVFKVKIVKSLEDCQEWRDLVS